RISPPVNVTQFDSHASINRFSRPYLAHFLRLPMDNGSPAADCLASIDLRTRLVKPFFASPSNL
ncbi:MAG: hypothetical protein ACKVI3_18280, partial [Verrucomicrobiia bacterium]